MDYFKRIQQVRRITGAGGWRCICCDIRSRKYKSQRRNKQLARRYARRYDKHLIKAIVRDNRNFKI